MKTPGAKFGRTLALLSVLLFLSALAAMVFGSVNLSLAQLWGGLLGKEGFYYESVILSGIRLPRMLAGILAGVGLSLSGLLLQTVTDNGLTAPNVIGVNAGAGLGAMLIFCLFPFAFALLPVAAFCGAFATTLLVLLLSQRKHGGKTAILLAGIAVASVLNACITLLTLLFPDALPDYVAFSIGSLAGVYLNDLLIPAMLIALCTVAVFLLAPKLNLLCLGDGMASSLGVNVKRIRLFAVLLASALCASVVCFAGLLGFVGLIVPHIARKLVGTDLKKLIPTCMLTGSCLLVLSDLLGRIVLAPSELPVGILMAFLGSPFFLFLLLGRRKSHA